MLPLDANPPAPLCRLLICNGETCGQNPGLEPETLREHWARDELHSTIAMKICTCQDACDHASVARIITNDGTEWYERLEREHYQALLEWARACKASGTLLPRPALLTQKRCSGDIRKGA